MPSTNTDILAQLRAIGEQDESLSNIGEGALLLASLDLPENNLADYRSQLGVIVSDLSAAAKGSQTLRDRIAALSEILYGRHRFRGDVETYDDPQNANLMRVMDRRKGLPVALGILAIHAGRSQGWDISGLNFPGHFLLRIGTDREHALIDPFDNARVVHDEDLGTIFQRLHGREMPRQADFFQSVPDRDILARLQNNIKIRALGAGDRNRAVEILQSITLIAPANGGVLMELARLEAASGNIMSALGRLNEFMARNSGAAHAAEFLSLKERLSRSLN